MSISYENIVNKNSVEKYFDNIKCFICNNILFYPQECTVCETAFCIECLNCYIANKYECPAKKCKDNYFKEGCGKAIEALNTTIISCNICEKLFPYKTYLDHVFVCDLTFEKEKKEYENYTYDDDEPAATDDLFEYDIKDLEYKTTNYDNGDRYEGYTLNNKKHGEGTYYYKDGCYYKGGYKEGKRHGKGNSYRNN